MESREIKDKRKKKFQDKVKNKNKEYKEDIPLINNITPIVENESSLQQNFSQPNGETNSNIINNSNNNIDNNSINNIKDEHTEKKLEYNQIFKKFNKIEFIKTILNIFKKIIIIIISIFHYLNYYNLNNIKRFKYTLLFVEITSLLLDIFYIEKLKRRVLKLINELNENHSNTKYDLPILQTFKLLKYQFFAEFTFLDHIFKFFNVLMEILVDIAIIFVVNFIFFIIYEEDD